MKGVFLLICAFVAHIHAQAQCGCGCSPLRPLPLCPRPPPQRPLPPCPRPAPCPPPCPPPPKCPRPIPPCRPYPQPLPRPCENPPIVEICDYNQAVVPLIQAPILSPPTLQQPLVGYEVCPQPLPSCNCPAPPTLPVSQLYPSFSPIIPPYVLNSGIGVSPCLGGVADFPLPVSPVGLINPFLPAASPLSALAPTVSSLYPPINPCGCGCHFLKKIPIPPPCI